MIGCLRPALAARAWEDVSYGGRLADRAELQLQVDPNTTCLGSNFKQDFGSQSNSEVFCLPITNYWPFPRFPDILKHLPVAICACASPPPPQCSMACGWFLASSIVDLVAQDGSRDETCYVRFGDAFHAVSQILVYLGSEVELGPLGLM